MIHNMLLILYLFSFCICISHFATALEKSITSLQELIYYDVQTENFAMCVRRLNATHQVGCSSKRSGSVGIVFYAKNQDDVEWLLFQSPQQSYVLVMTGKMFQSDISAMLIGSSKIAGIVIMIEDEGDRPGSFSPDVPCPNDHSGLYWKDDQYSGCKKTVWNPDGNGMIFMEIPFPIVIVSNSIDEEFIIRNCFEKFNGHRDDSDVPKCAMEIRDVMYGAKDTVTCMRRNKLTNMLALDQAAYCHPVRGINAFAYLDVVNVTYPLDAGSVTIIAARMDSFSLFESRYPGYQSAVLGFVTLHAVAEALGRVRRSQALTASRVRPLMFVLFSGESFDYIGSSRMVYDIEQEDFFPLTPESIGTFIEVGQVELNNITDSLWIHTDPVSIDKNQDIRSRVNSLASVITSFGVDVGLSIKRTSQGSPLPPASVQQFLKSPKTSIAGVVLSSHEKEFSNRYYNSLFDNANQTGPKTYSEITPTVQHVQKIATIVARTLYSLLFGRTAAIENIHASNTTIANLLYCFTREPDCELFSSTISVNSANNLKKFRESYLTSYIGDAALVLSHQHRYLLAHFLGDAIDGIENTKACDALENDIDGYFYIFENGPLSNTDNSRNPICIRSTAASVRTSSPAFSIPDYDWSSERYSSWTESYWEDEKMSVRIFLMPSWRQEIVTLCIGLVGFIVSLLVVFLVHWKSSIIFKRTQ